MMELFIGVNGKTNFLMERERCIFLIPLTLLALLLRESQMAREGLSMNMESITREVCIMDKLLERGYFVISINRILTKDIGTKIYLTERELKNGQPQNIGVNL
eukprot:GHVR01163078.1.p1 GENE.GHVR01163078.1~~GHVR01163078.1.p1  ORF type:complete len:103 (+),score=2.08 GHVR01163078.1:2156-2464(+)